MTAPRFFTEDVTGERVVLTGDEAHHAVRVLRIRPGEVITVSDGRGAVVRATVRDAGRELNADVVERRNDPRPVPSLVVVHGIPKAGKLDLVVQKLTELGVDEIAPVAMERSVARWDQRKAAEHTARLAAIAREAAKQSRRAWLPEVRAPGRLVTLELSQPAFVLHEEAADRLVHRLPEAAPATLTLVVGPEGGLTSDEVSRLVEAGAAPVSLGPLVLRTETAALAAAVVVLTRYGRIG